MSNNTSAGAGPDRGESRGYALRRALDAQGHRARLAAQVRLALSSVDGAASHPADSPGEMQYLYQEGRILVRDADLDRVRAVVAGDIVDSLVNGLTVYAPRDQSTLAALEAIDA